MRGKEKGESADRLRCTRRNWRKIEAAENDRRRRRKRACCLILNRIIFSPCRPFIYVIFPDIYSYVNAGCVAAGNHIGVPAPSRAHPATVSHRHTHTAALGNPKGIAVDAHNPIGSGPGGDAADFSMDSLWPAYFFVFISTARPLESDVWLCDRLFTCTLEWDARPTSPFFFFYSFHQPVSKDTKTKPRPACILTIILIPLLKPRAWDLSGSWPAGLIELFQAPVWVG